MRGPKLRVDHNKETKTALMPFFLSSNRSVTCQHALCVMILITISFVFFSGFRALINVCVRALTMLFA